MRAARLLALALAVAWCCGSVSAQPWEQKLLSLANAAREEVGAPPLCLNAKLTAAAQAHSEDQAARQLMGHNGSDGSHVGERATRAGYAWWLVGENVAWNYRGVQSVFEVWMSSEGHRANILNPGFTHMGAARVQRDASAGPYWTQVFSTGTESCS